MLPPVVTEVSIKTNLDDARESPLCIMEKSTVLNINSFIGMKTKHTTFLIRD